MSRPHSCTPALVLELRPSTGSKFIEICCHNVVPARRPFVSRGKRSMKKASHLLFSLLLLLCYSGTAYAQSSSPSTPGQATPQPSSQSNGARQNPADAAKLQADQPVPLHWRRSRRISCRWRSWQSSITFAWCSPRCCLCATTSSLKPTAVHLKRSLL